MLGIKLAAVVFGFVVLLVVGLWLSGCTDGSMMPCGMFGRGSGATTPPPGVVNAICPIMGGSAKATLTRDYKDQKVGFCCPPCLGKWDRLSESDKAARLGK